MKIKNVLSKAQALLEYLRLDGSNKMQGNLAMEGTPIAAWRMWTSPWFGPVNVGPPQAYDFNFDDGTNDSHIVWSGGMPNPAPTVQTWIKQPIEPVTCPSFDGVTNYHVWAVDLTAMFGVGVTAYHDDSCGANQAAAEAYFTAWSGIPFGPGAANTAFWAANVLVAGGPGADYLWVPPPGWSPSPGYTEPPVVQYFTTIPDCFVVDYPTGDFYSAGDGDVDGNLSVGQAGTVDGTLMANSDITQTNGGVTNTLAGPLRVDAGGDAITTTAGNIASAAQVRANTDVQATQHLIAQTGDVQVFNGILNQMTPGVTNQLQGNLQLGGHQAISSGWISPDVLLSAQESWMGDLSVWSQKTGMSFSLMIQPNVNPSNAQVFAMLGEAQGDFTNLPAPAINNENITGGDFSARAWGNAGETIGGNVICFQAYNRGAFNAAHSARIMVPIGIYQATEPNESIFVRPIGHTARLAQGGGAQGFCEWWTGIEFSISVDSGQGVINDLVGIDMTQANLDASVDPVAVGGDWDWIRMSDINLAGGANVAGWFRGIYILPMTAGVAGTRGIECWTDSCFRQCDIAIDSGYALFFEGLGSDSYIWYNPAVPQIELWRDGVLRQAW